MKMTLSRALRYKKRVVETIRVLENDIISSNSVIEGEERTVDISASLAKREKMVDHLLSLKKVTQQFTLPIMHKILLIAELKSEAAFMQRIPTHSGVIKPKYQGDQTLTYFCTIRKDQKDQRITEIQDQIDVLQTEIDHYNAVTTIEVEDV